MKCLAGFTYDFQLDPLEGLCLRHNWTKARVLKCLARLLSFGSVSFAPQVYFERPPQRGNDAHALVCLALKQRVYAKRAETIA
jgi:hypothetical protein